MVGRESALHLLKTLVQQSPADQTEAILLTEDSSLTRFAGSASSPACGGEEPDGHSPGGFGEEDRRRDNQYFSAVFIKKISSESSFPCQGSTTQRGIHFSARAETHP